MSAFDKQQTVETIRQNIEFRFSTFSTDEQLAKSEKEYKADKLRKCKIRMIEAWRKKND